jgi:ribose-phosphate pyrophosphokinase
MCVDTAYVFKRRITEERTEVAAVSADVEGRQVVIYDDMIRSGATLLSAAEACLQAGASSLAVVAVHGVLPGDALDRLKASGLFSGIVCTDSHPRARELAGDFLCVQSVDALLAGLLENGG